MQLASMQHPLDDRQDTQIFEADDAATFEIPTDSVEQTPVCKAICVAHTLLCPCGCWTAEAAAPLQPPVFGDTKMQKRALVHILACLVGGVALAGCELIDEWPPVGAA
jgi:hypothetical protein